MARHALHGEFSVFFWLQTYAGSLEALVTAPFFAVFGSSTLLLKLVSAAFYAVSALVVWRIGVRVLGEPRATYAGVLFWIAPAFLVWASTKAYLYGGAILCGLLALLLVLRLDEQATVREWALLGLVLGVGWWVTPTIVLTAAPALGWLAVRAPASWRRAWPAVPAFLVGASPWLAWNVRNGWLSLHVASGAAGAHQSYAERLADVFRYTLPTWLGLRVPYSLDWLLGRAVGIALVAAALAALACGIAGRTRALEPLLLVMVAFPFLEALSPFTSFVKEPRYLAVVGGVIALLLAWPLRRTPVAAAVLAGVLALSIAGLAVMEHQRDVQFGIGTVKIPGDLSPLLRRLEREHATRVIANYWLAYRIDFESKERIVATSSGFVRYVRTLPPSRFEDYIATLTVDGPLRALAEDDAEEDHR